MCNVKEIVDLIKQSTPGSLVPLALSLSRYFVTVSSESILLLSSLSLDKDCSASSVLGIPVTTDNILVIKLNIKHWPHWRLW